MNEQRGAPGLPSALLAFVGPLVLIALAVTMRASGRVDSGRQIVDRIATWLDLARAVAESEGVPLPLLLAVASTESGGRTTARSGAGAVGLMQLRPGTAGDMARLGGEPDPVLTDPETSLRLGARYLALQLKRFEARPHARELALCAYNAGPNRVRIWLAELPPARTARPPVEWVPWKEPRDYLARVARWERHWTERLAAGAPAE